MCPGNYDPICGIEGKTYYNTCYAQQANVSIACEGSCPCKCFNGTEYGKCSLTKPLFCYDGQLINNCSVCGCLEGKTCQSDESCKVEEKKQCSNDSNCASLICPQVIGGDKPKCDLKTATCYCGGTCGDGYCDSVEKRDGTCPADCDKCSDGTHHGECSINKPKYCDNDSLIDNCQVCGCPLGQECQGNGSCIVLKCSDDTPYNECSATKPLFCDNGQLINNCSVCGCPEGKTCQSDESCEEILEEAYFRFDYPPRPPTFIFKLTNPEKIREARDILAGRITDRIHVSGVILKEPATYNPPWSYHLDPSSIAFFEMAMEVCDAGIQAVEDHLDEVCGGLLPQCLWCPWGSTLIEEVDLSYNCSDGTPYGSCSFNKPKYCAGGQLVDNCSLCGCNFGEECGRNESCRKIPPRVGTEIRISTPSGLKTVSIEKVSENTTLIKTGNISAVTTQNVTIEEDKLYMETSAGKKQIKVLPEEAVSKATEINIVTGRELIEENGKPVYSIKGTKKVRILLIIPASMEIETKVNAENGEVISVNKPWWSLFAW